MPLTNGPESFLHSRAFPSSSSCGCFRWSQRLNRCDDASKNDFLFWVRHAVAHQTVKWRGNSECIFFPFFFLTTQNHNNKGPLLLGPEDKLKKTDEVCVKPQFFLCFGGPSSFFCSFFSFSRARHKVFMHIVRFAFF